MTDTAPPPVDPERPAPSGTIGNPFLVLFAVLCLITAVTLALVQVNGDDFAEARIPRRALLPGGTDVAALREAFAGEPEIAASLPVRREVVLRVSPPALPTSALAYEMESPSIGTLLELASALGFPEELDSQGPFRVTATDRLQLMIRSNGGARFETVETYAEDCPPGALCPELEAEVTAPRQGIGGVTVPTTVARRQEALSAEQRARRLRSSLVDIIGGDVKATRQPDDSWTVEAVPGIDGQGALAWRSDVVIAPDGSLTSAVGWAGRAGSSVLYPLAPLGVALDRLGSGDYAFEGFDPTRSSHSDGPPAPPPTGPIEVTGVRLGLQLQDAGDEVFLAPVYVFSTVDDGEVPVAAVTDIDLRRNQSFSFSRSGTGRSAPLRSVP